MSELETLHAALRQTLRDVDPRRLRRALSELEPSLRAEERRRTRIRLRRLRFAGQAHGELTFQPGVNVLRAGNDKGKSSVLKLLQLCLTGKNDLKKDVDGWIDRVELTFELDGEPHTVRLEKRGRARGRLLRGPSGTALPLVEFKSGKEMREKLEAFFNEAFALRPLAGTQKDSRKGSDALLDSVTSYRAFFRGMYIDQDHGYTDLLTEGKAYGNLYLKVLGTLLGLPGLEGYFAAEARRAHVENALGKEARYHRRLERSLELPDLATLGEEIDRLESYIDELKARRSALYVRSASSDLDRRLVILGEQLLEAQETAERKARDLLTSKLRLEAAEARLEELAAAGEERCSVCAAPVAWIARGHRPAECGCALSRALLPAAPEPPEAEEPESSLATLRRRVARLEGEHADLAARVRQLGQERRTLQDRLRSSHQSTAELDREIELESRYLGRLEADRERATRLVASEAEPQMGRLLERKKILDAAVRHLRTRHGERREGIKNAFAERVQTFATTLGFPNLEEITLDGQLRPRIRQNGKVHTFEELSPGEKVRFVLAFHLALALASSEDPARGTHPGLLLIDSPGKEEMVRGDFEAVVGLLRTVEERHAEVLQVVVASTLPAIAGATAPEKQVYIDDDRRPLFEVAGRP